MLARRWVASVVAGVVIAMTATTAVHAEDTVAGSPRGPETPIDVPAWRDAPGEGAGRTVSELSEEQRQYEAHLRLQAAEAGVSDPATGARERGLQEFDETVDPDEEVAEVAVGGADDAFDAGTPSVGETSGVAAATAATGFTAGNLIIDANFYNGSAMSESQIQSFLQARVGTCKNSYCLANYKVDTPTRTWSWGTCSTYTGGKAESAARIIYKVQRACNISARVILVTLEKEQSLISDPDPGLGQMQKAMGYGCPDTSACDTTYYGFFNQVYAAGRQLTWYGNPEGSFTWIKVGSANRILYHPDAARCGGSDVVIQNRATAALYYYTPYQPNAEALANLYDTGDTCSSYGNRNFWRIHRDWFGDPRQRLDIPWTRYAGSDRYGTAVAVSKATYPNAGVPVAYVASGLDYPDALSAAPAAAAQGGPLLLTGRTSLPSTTASELARLKPAKIVLVGGTGVVSSTVQSGLAKIAPTVRISGANRYETSRRIADYAFGTVTTAYLATGTGYADALSAGAAAGKVKGPIVLVHGTARSADTATRNLLSALGVDEVRIAGGTAVVSSGIESSLKASFTVKRYAGSDRYATSASVVRGAYGSGGPAYLATGAAYPDALAGAAAAGKVGAPLLLSRPTCVPSSISSVVLDKGISQLRLLGGSAVLSDRVARLTRC
ncbi:cell wall-binding repeat-containing protein [Agromyces sp. GXS1127]|uniref:cell wall-binding repeat-containing protein n=1 Tax=Agromyces sp. GXS1127 TaxID=3424181 RepID=UPI003D310B3B